VELRPAVIQNETTLKHHGRSYNVEVADLHVLQCAACGERLFGNEAHEQINRALRQKIGVMQPSEIRKNRKERGLTQTDLAAGVDAALATRRGAQEHSVRIASGIRFPVGCGRR
jgi:nitric oxide reductase activation protein